MVTPVALQRAPTARWVTWTVYFSLGLLGAPLSILLHEAAHFVLALCFAFDEVRFHYQSVTYAGEERVFELVWAGKLREAGTIYPLRHVAWTAMAGPLVNHVLSSGLAVLVHRRWSRIAAALGPLLAGRAFMIGYFVIFEPTASRNDEDLVARILGFSPVWLAAVGLAIAATATLWIFRSMPRSERLPGLLGTFAGGSVGGYLYLSHVGPWLLP